MSTLLNLTLRPLRLAVVADCRSPDGILNALQATTMQWGGSANPLVPYFDEYPPSLSELVFERIDSLDAAFEQIARYHDPDRALSVVNAQLTLPIESVALAHILEEKPADSCVGVSLLELARLFAYDQLRFVRREPIRTVCIETSVEELKLTAAILYGTLPPNLRDAFLAAMSSTVAPTVLNTLDIYEPYFDGDVTPRVVGQYRLSFANQVAVGCMRAMDPLDALTIWNVGVEHRSVIPLPLGTEMSAKLLERLIWHLRKNEINRILVIRGPSVANAEIEPIFEALRSAEIGVLFYDYAGRAPTKFERRDTVHGTARRASRTMEDDADGLAVDLLGLRLIGRDNLLYGVPRYVNEVSVKNFDRRWLPADVLPPGIKRFWSRPFPLLHDYRVAETGLCLLANRTEERESVPLPDATAIVRAYLESRGFETSISSQGLAFQQLLILTNGATSLFNHPKLRKILQLFDTGRPEKDEPAATSRVVTWPDIQRVVQDEPEHSLRILLNAKLLEAGILLQCDNCGGHEFYLFSELQAPMPCKRCQLTFAPPFYDPRSMETWAYRLLPPFDNQKARRGLLGMTFAFSVLDDSPGDKTIAAGINLVRSGTDKVDIEVDFIALQKPAYDRSEVVPLFLEVKHGQSFTRLDVARMAFLLRLFPYGVFGFSTTRSVSEIEPHVLRRLRRFSQLRQGRREPTHTTMLLTQRELRASFERIEEGDHIIGYFREIGLETTKRYLTTDPPSYVQWRAARDEAAKTQREQSIAKLAASARAIRARPGS